MTELATTDRMFNTLNNVQFPGESARVDQKPLHTKHLNSHPAKCEFPRVGGSLSTRTIAHLGQCELSALRQRKLRSTRARSREMRGEFGGVRRQRISSLD